MSPTAQPSPSAVVLSLFFMVPVALIWSMALLSLSSWRRGQRWMPCRLHALCTAHALLHDWPEKTRGMGPELAAQCKACSGLASHFQEVNHADGQRPLHDFTDAAIVGKMCRP